MRDRLFGTYTGRGGEYLAQAYGFESVTNLAETLPQNARVVDVGAGTSTLGHEIGALRKDVQWHNIDVLYCEDSPLVRLTEIPQTKYNTDLLPPTPSVSNIYGDITGRARALPKEFDLVLSWWLLPHIANENTRYAHRALKNMGRIAKLGAPVYLGPVYREGISVRLQGEDLRQYPVRRKLLQGMKVPYPKMR